MRIVIVGGGAAGLLASLLLARVGHDVVLLEQDDLSPAPDVESAAAAALRPAAPQVVHPHRVMSRCREVLRECLPDVYEDLLAAGTVEVVLADLMPASLSDHTVLAGDDRLVSLATRRSTLDWVLWRAALAEPAVVVRRGVRALGLTARVGAIPHVTGIRTDQGDLAVDLVVDACGRRSPVERWLDDIGAPSPATWSAACGLTYYSRHYRLRRGTDLPGPATTRMVEGFDEFTIALFGTDNCTMQLAVAPLTTDRRFRGLANPEVFTAVVGTVAAYRQWLEVLDPISAIFQMVAPRNFLRRLVVEGSPVVTGLHAIGDSACTTNPTLGRGLTLAAWMAADLVATLDEHPGDRAEQSLVLDGLVADHVAPFYEEQAAVDSARLTALRATIADQPVPDPARSASDRIAFAELRDAALFDPVAFRAFVKVMGMLCRPDEIYTDRLVVTHTRDALRGHAPRRALEGPTRRELLLALGG